MSGRYQDDVLPCDRTRVRSGSTYDPPPVEWRGHTRACASCGLRFTVTAAEQRFWYEELGIPLIVGIKRCVACRGRARAERHITARLCDLVPKAKAGTATPLEQRELVLTTARAAQHVLVDRQGHGLTLVRSRSLIESSAGVAERLRQEQRGHQDLLAVQVLLHRHLGNLLKAERLERELAALIEKTPALAKPVQRLRDWLAAPTRRLWTHVSQPSRL